MAAALMTFALLLTGTVPAAVAAPETDQAVVFSDVPEGMMFYREMSWLANEGISTGWDDGTYRPLRAINRDAMAAFLYRLAGEPEFVPPTDSPFTDVSTTQLFYKEMAWLQEQGISTGWEENDGSRTYRPLQAINRDAMAAFLYRFTEVSGTPLPAASPFSDIGPGTQFYAEMVWLYEAGIATGWDDGTYRPLQPINRDAMAAYLYRLSLPTPDEGVVLAPETQILDPDTDVTGFNPVTGVVTLPSATNGTPDVDPGDVLVSGFSPSTPDGMLVRVHAVTTADDGVQTATVTQATLPDAIFATEGPLSTSGTVVRQEVIPAEGVQVIENIPGEPAPNALDSIRDDATIDSAPESAPNADLDLYNKYFTFSEVVTRTTSGTAWKNVQLSGTGTLALGAEFGVETGVNAEIDLGWASLKEAQFTLDTSLDAKITGSALGELTGSAQRSLGVVNTWAHLQVGPVPVAVQFTSSVDLFVGSQWKADAFATIEASSTTSVGMAYQDGSFKKIAEFEGDAGASFKGPELTSESTISMGPALSAKLYGMVGLSGGFDVYATYRTATGVCAHEAGLRGKVGLVAGIEVLGINLTDEWKKEFTKNLILWSGDSCESNEPPVDEVAKDVFGPGLQVVDDGGTGDGSQWGQAQNYGPGGPAWILSTGRMQDSIGNADDVASTPLGQPGSSTLSAFIGGGQTFDAASYWAEVVPSGNTLNIRYFFASEEYPEYVGSAYNDVMGVFVNGQNCAVVPGTALPVAVNTVNDQTNSQYYINNLGGASGFNTAMDGLTVPLQCTVPVQPGVKVRVEIAVADTADGILDSAVALLDGGIWSD